MQAGDVYRSEGVQMFMDYLPDDRGDPTVEKWSFANCEDDPHQGYGHLRLMILEVVPTRHSGMLVVYRKVWIAPDGEQINSGRRCVGGLASVKGLISRRKMKLED